MIVADADYILLDYSHTGHLTLQATVQEQAKKTAFLFKIKCNILEAVQTKPSHGLILPNNKIILRVRYKGAVAEISKVKLKVYYMEIGNISADNIRAIRAESYTRFRERLGAQHQNVLDFRLLLSEQPTHALRSQFRYSRDSTQSQKVQTRNSLKNLYDMQGQKGAVLTKTDQNKTPINRTSTLGFRQLLFYSILAFLLGVSFGIKISKMQ